MWFLPVADLMKLQRAKEQNEKLDAENRALRERVHTLESQNKKILMQVAMSLNCLSNRKTVILLQPSHVDVWSLFVQLAINDTEQDAAKEQQKEKNVSGDVQNENDAVHKR